MPWKKIEHDFNNQTIMFEMKPGNSVEGKFIERRPRHGKMRSDIIVIENEKGEKIALWENTVLKRKLKEIPIGKKLKITYLGIPEKKTYHNYDVEVWEEN